MIKSLINWLLSFQLDNFVCGWRSDWKNAPKDKRFLVLLSDEEGLEEITTAEFFLETAHGEIDGYDGNWWALHDCIRDCPLDDGGPPEDQGLLWRPLL